MSAARRRRAARFVIRTSTVRFINGAGSVVIFFSLRAGRHSRFGPRTTVTDHGVVTISHLCVSPVPRKRALARIGRHVALSACAPFAGCAGVPSAREASGRGWWRPDRWRARAIAAIEAGVAWTPLRGNDVRDGGCPKGPPTARVRRLGRHPERRTRGERRRGHGGLRHGLGDPRGARGDERHGLRERGAPRGRVAPENLRQSGTQLGRGASPRQPHARARRRGTGQAGAWRLWPRARALEARATEARARRRRARRTRGRRGAPRRNGLGRGEAVREKGRLRGDAAGGASRGSASRGQCAAVHLVPVLRGHERAHARPGAPEAFVRRPGGRDARRERRRGGRRIQRV